MVLSAIRIVDDFDSALNSTQRLIDLGCKTLLCVSVDNLVLVN
jgi:LacI family transcriptional regulator